MDVFSGNDYFHFQSTKKGKLNIMTEYTAQPHTDYLTNCNFDIQQNLQLTCISPRIMKSYRLSRESSTKSDFSCDDNAFESALDEAQADDEIYDVDLGDDTDEIFQSIQKHDKAVSASNLSSIDKRRFSLPMVKELSSDGSVITKASLSMRDAYKKMKSIPQNLGRKMAGPEKNLPFERRVSDRIPTRRLSRKGIRTDESTRDFEEESDMLSLPSKSSRMVSMGHSRAIPPGSFSNSSYRSKPSLSHRALFVESSKKNVPSDKPVASTVNSLPPYQRNYSLNSSTSYRVPMPAMPFETKRGTLVRVTMGFIFLALSATFTLLGAGNGKVGMSISSWLYNNFILDEAKRAGVAETPSTSNGSHLFESLRGLERTYEPNINGIADYHTPLVLLNGAELEVEVGLKPHVMSENHFIKYIWLRDVDANSIVLAKEFQPTDDSPPSLIAKVPLGVKLQPYVFCIVHELWIGEPFEVGADN